MPRNSDRFVSGRRGRLIAEVRIALAARRGDPQLLAAETELGRECGLTGAEIAANIAFGSFDTKGGAAIRLASALLSGDDHDVLREVGRAKRAGLKRQEIAEISAIAGKFEPIPPRADQSKEVSSDDQH